MFITADSFAREGENAKINELIKLSPVQLNASLFFLPAIISFWVPRSIAWPLSPLFDSEGVSATDTAHASVQGTSGPLEGSVVPTTARGRNNPPEVNECSGRQQ